MDIFLRAYQLGPSMIWWFLSLVRSMTSHVAYYKWSLRRFLLPAICSTPCSASQQQICLNVASLASRPVYGYFCSNAGVARLQ